MKTHYRRLIALGLGIFLTMNSHAQQHTEQHPLVSLSLHWENMHLWRGMEVTPSSLFVTDLHLMNTTNSFNFGLWGGAGINGDYKEFDYYTSYTKHRITLSLWDIYNFSPGATYNNRQLFNYARGETGHFIDFSMGYRLPLPHPLNLNWATIIYGRDRDAVNKQNRYSTYVTVNYQLINDQQTIIRAGLSGAFAFSPGKNLDGQRSKANFYGTKPGIVDATLQGDKTIDIAGLHIPVTLTAMWNPRNNYGNIEIDVGLLQ